MAVPGLWKTPEEEKEYINNLFTEYQFSCLHEKNAEGCQLLGDYLQVFKKDFKWAAKVYIENCEERNFPRSCYNSGSFYLLGRGVPKDVNKAECYLKKACELNEGDSCYTRGMILTEMGSDLEDTKLTKEQYCEGLDNLIKGCALKNSKACLLASKIYEYGSPGAVKMNMTKALYYAEKACHFLEPLGCVNACRWYRKGVGAEKNDELADHYKAKARELNKQCKKGGLELQQHV